jgi:hypothetical protein
MLAAISSAPAHLRRCLGSLGLFRLSYIPIGVVSSVLHLLTSPVLHLTAELMSASPVLQSFSPNLAAVKAPAAKHNCPYFSLSQPRGPLQTVRPQNFRADALMLQNGAGLGSDRTHLEAPLIDILFSRTLHSSPLCFSLSPAGVSPGTGTATIT